MIKAFAVGALTAAAMFGSTFGASAQTFSGTQTAAINACSEASLAAGGGDCAIALCALQPGEYPPILPVINAGVGSSGETLNDALASCNIATGAIGPVTPVTPGTPVVPSTGGAPIVGPQGSAA